LTTETCKTCKFYFQPEKPAELTDVEKSRLPNVGQCRVRAPTVGFVVMPKFVPDIKRAGQQVVPSIERGTAFPSVHDDVWCGEHQASA
jgi:hypothetical protein